MDDLKLPPLPEPMNFHSAVYVGPSLGFTADQMHAHAIAAVKAERHRCLDACASQMQMGDGDEWDRAVWACGKAIAGTLPPPRLRFNFPTAEEDKAHYDRVLASMKDRANK